MFTYKIYSNEKARLLGVYKAASADEALTTYARSAGYNSVQEAEQCHFFCVDRLVVERMDYL